MKVSPNAGWLRRLASPTAQSVLWQGLGSAATLGAVAWVTHRLGLAAQAEFGLIKSWFDAAMVLVALGLPQGVLHLMYRLGVPARQVAQRVFPWLAGLAACATAIGALLLWRGHGVMAALVLSLPWGVAHMLARSLLLARCGAVVFGFFTALPALSLFLALLATYLLGTRPPFEWLIGFSVMLSGVVGWTVAWRAVGREAHTEFVTWPGKPLRDVCVQAYWQAAFSALMGASLLSTLAWVHRSPVQLGEASLSLYAYQAFGTVTGYMAPLLYDRFARQASPALRSWPAGARVAMQLMALLGVLGVVTALAAPSMARWLLPLALTTLAGVCALGARVLGVILLARGDYVELSRQALGRLVLAVAVAAGAALRLESASALALALVVVELATWLRSIQWLEARS